ncbi:MAG TPA: TIGR04454 family lipoprotein [Leptospiraceae bacterium]|nr:TIGR04454 family lipoprotein [Leptospiraceae bacterium]HNF16942.1 TIGR04454 family lipoprotein [Leptospiraceae bacterium]HNF27494.1 TIGR04454 family lipoprotein [Leptospiraceae bacterium]HNM02312.1 TIGR04454 family lipoprotein [Leptospiraceae bacterium]HNN03977.1 TIGR04454 family lipoprotein [Leptospiraceae bacterium]
MNSIPIYAKCRKNIQNIFEKDAALCRKKPAAEKNKCLNTAAVKKKNLLRKCGKASPSLRGQCSAAADTVIKNFKKANPAKADTIEDQKASLKYALMQDCRTGEYDIDCLKKVKDPVSIQPCRKD